MPITYSDKPDDKPAPAASKPADPPKAADKPAEQPASSATPDLDSETGPAAQQLHPQLQPGEQD